MVHILRKPHVESFDDLADSIRQGGVVGFPTDTVYGIGASIHCESALERIYQIKGRSFGKPLPVLVASKGYVAHVAMPLTGVFDPLVRRFWPGALTLIVQARPDLSPRITAHGNTVGVRMPDHPVALALLRSCGGLLATTSANRTGEAEARRLSDLVQNIGHLLDCIIEDDCGEQLPSTVLDLTQIPPRVRRVGPITAAQIEEVIGTVV